MSVFLRMAFKGYTATYRNYLNPNLTCNPDQEQWLKKEITEHPPKIVGRGN